MTISRHVHAGIGLFAAGLFAIILGSHATGSASASASTPVILSTAPAMPAPRDEPQRVTIRGEDFLPGLTLEVTTPNGQTTTYSGDDIQGRQNTAFSVMLMLDTRGEYAIRVTNTDGGVSDPYTVKVEPGDPEPMAPVISRVTPGEPVQQPQPQTLRVEGENFERGLRPIVTDPIGQEVVDVTVEKVNASSFEMMVLLDKAGNYELVVSNPSGAVSNVWRITVR